MRLLLDTHVFVWAVAEPEHLPDDIVAKISALGSSIFVSAATVWELAIKHGRGRGDDPPFSGQDAIRFAAEAGFTMLPITHQHASAVAELPRIHADPFDRLLIAQARHEPLTLVTHDKAVTAYDVPVLTW